MEMPKGMILRWLETLGNNNFVVQFRDGKDHGNADALSRCDHAPNKPDHDDPMDEEVVAQMQAHNNLICALVYPDEMTAGDIAQHQERDEILHEVRQWIRNQDKPLRTDLRGEDRDLQQYWSLYEVLYLDEQGVLKRRSLPGEFFRRDRLCLPEALQQQAIQACHEMLSGHMGVNVTQHRLVQRFYFPGLHKKAEEYVTTCLPCQAKRGRPQDQWHALVFTQDGNPFQKLSIDFVGPLP